MTLAYLITLMPNTILLKIYNEVQTGIMPTKGVTHTLCRRINKLIDQGKLCINPITYQRTYAPTLVRMTIDEMARRWATTGYGTTQMTTDEWLILQEVIHNVG